MRRDYDHDYQVHRNRLVKQLGFSTSRIPAEANGEFLVELPARTYPPSNVLRDPC